MGRNPIVAFCDVNRKTEAIVGTSSERLGGILVTSDDEDIGKDIAYANRALTDIERHYAQIEREALAVVWSCERFHIYIYGSPVTVVTDHKPLRSMYCNLNSKLRMRLKRWPLWHQPYDITLRYAHGASDPADYLSHHPLSNVEKTSKEEKIAEEPITIFLHSACPEL